MESGYSTSRVNGEEIHPQLLDLIPKERNWFVKKDNDDHHHSINTSKRSHENGDEKKLELRLGPPCVEDWSLSNSQNNYKSPAKPPQKRLFNRPGRVKDQFMYPKMLQTDKHFQENTNDSSQPSEFKNYTAVSPSI